MNNELFNEDDQEFDIIEYLNVLIYYRKLIIFVIVVSFVFGIIKYRYTPSTYTTNATILIDKDQSDPSSFISNNEFDFIYDVSRENEDQVSVFKSTSILSNVIEQTAINYKYYKKNRFKSNTLIAEDSLPFVFSFKSNAKKYKADININDDNININLNNETFSLLKNKTEFENSFFKYNPKYNNPKNNSYIINKLPYSEVINDLKENINIDLTKNSNIYEVSYSGPNPMINSRVLSSVVESIQSQNKRNKESIFKLSIDFITSRIYELDNEIDSLNFVISNYKVLNNVYKPEIQTSSALENLNDIQQKIFKSNLQKELSLKLINELKKPNYFKLLPSDIGIAEENINKMVYQFNQIILEKNNLLVDATEKNPLLIQVQDQLQDLKNNIINSLNIYIKNLEMTLSRYTDYKRKSNSIVGVIPIKEAELANLERDLVLVINLHSYLKQKKEEALINLYSVESNIKLINKVDYNVKLNNNRSNILLIAFLTGLFLSIAIVFIVVFFKNLFVNTDYLKIKLRNIHFLGIVKLIKQSQSDELKDVQTELYKILLHNIKVLLPKTDKASSLMITSSIKNEGKTFTSYHIAKYLSLSGNRVILLGTDSKNPDLSKFYNKINSRVKGITDIIYNHESDFKDLFEKYKISQDKFDTILIGTLKKEFIGTFQNKRFIEFYNYLKQNYEYIIFDTAPIQYMADPLDLLDKSDLVIHVFRKHFSNKKTADFMLEYKTKYDLNNLAYLVTDDSKPDKLLEKYSYGYSYAYGV
ncbi:MAG: hypothetical protein CL832_00135 [Crocinitomicaceae bacterium]|nr:hypothetical protein [Crocinitomicaceae bacterium]